MKRTLEKIPLLMAAVLLLAAVACSPASTPIPPRPTSMPVPSEIPAPPDEEVFSPQVVWRVAFEQEQGANVIESLVFSPDASLIAVGVHPEVRLYSAANGELARAIEHRHTVESLDFSPDGTQLGAGQGVYGVRLSKVVDGEEIQTLGSGYNSVVAFSPDGETVASGNRDGIIWLWRLTDSELLSSFERPEAGSPTDRWMKALVFSPDGALVASAHWDGRIHVWQVSSGTLLHTLEAPEGPSGTGTIAFSPDGSLLAVNGAREDGSHGVRLWQVSDGKPLRVLTGHANETTDVAFSPDGSLLVSGGSTRDGTVKLWQTPDWSLWHSLEHLDAQGKIDWITTVAFSPDGKNLVVGTQSGLIWFWQVQP